jgi:nucleoside-diphosphate-sugar epimerase
MTDRLIVGCGYLGRRVAARWRADGGRVWATTRSPRRSDELRGLGVEPIIADVLDPSTLRRLPTVATVLYCVGLDRAAGVPMRRLHVGGLGNVLDVLPAPGRLVYISSTSVYGQTGGEEVDETAATEPVEESGAVVLEAEGLLRGRLPAAVVLRFAGIYGPERLLRAQALKAGEPIGGGAEKWLNLIHVEDGAAAVLAAEARGAPGGVYNVSDGCPVRRSEFYGCLAELLGAPPPQFGPSAEGVNRRIVSHRLRAQTGWTPRYPDCRVGLQASL